jgi:hypothetical protein
MFRAGLLCRWLIVARLPAATKLSWLTVSGRHAAVRAYYALSMLTDCAAPGAPYHSAIVEQ